MIFALALVMQGGHPARAEEEKTKAVVVAMAPDEVEEFASEPEPVRELIRSALELTRKNLGYRFGSASEENGGMDCSGAVYRVLREVGLPAPRSSRAMFAWIEEEGNLHRCGESIRTPEDPVFRELRPGDLLFWSGTYETGKGGDAISHVMIYVGTSKADGEPVLFGASSGRSYRGKRIHGVSVFDFRIPKPDSRSRLVGFASVPGLRGEEKP